MRCANLADRTVQPLRDSRPALISLNIRAGGGKRVAALLGYLDGHDADTVVLTEWRDTPSGRAFAAWAAARGMLHAAVTDGGTANGVFIASRDAFTASSVTPEGDCPGVLALARFADFTLLACYFPQLQAKAPFFARCAELAIAHAGRPFLLLGDLNTGNQVADRSEAAGPYACPEAFDDLVSRCLPHDLWRRTHGAEAREWSWLSHRGNGFRIDHALANTAFVEWGRPVCGYDHHPRQHGWTDHSALIVRLG